MEKVKKSEKKSSKDFEFAVGKDPTKVRVVKILLIVFLALAFAVSLLTINLTASANAHSGLFFVGKEYSVQLYNYSTGLAEKTGAVITKTDDFTTGDVVGVLFLTSEGSVEVCLKTVETVNTADGEVTFRGENEVFDINRVIGVYKSDIDSAFVLALISDPVIMVLITLVFIVLAVITALIYFLISPRGAKKFEKKDESGEKAAPVVAFSTDNASLLMKYLSSDDNIAPLEQDDNVLPGSVNTNYYGSVRLHDGEVYAVVKKYTEVVPSLEEFGASDMDIIKMNMVGNSEFENLILLPHKEKTMTMQEVIDFIASLPGVYCIKKRGTLNWVYKYKSKTILIVKENDDHNGFKVSAKVYPDAAYKLNIIYKALEDSTFPIGPFWYMFNNLRNLPGNVIKWLITESYRISKWQQIRADILRDTPPLENYGYDVAEIRSKILSGTRIADYNKFTIITQQVTDESKYSTVLETGFDGLDVEPFTKEFTMLVPHTDNLMFSMLSKKNASEALLTSFCNEMDAMCEETAQAPAGDPANEMTRIVRRTATVKKKKK